MEFQKRKIIDGHIHYAFYGYQDSLMAILNDAGIEKFSVVCTPDMARLSLVPDAVLLKAAFPERVYLFGGMDISPLYVMPDQVGVAFADYVNTLRGLGADGIKMIEGKVQMRKLLPIPDFDAPVYEPYWQKLAETQMPLTFHVNDPEEFWDPVKVPDWAREMGWFYGDGSYINNEVQYRQVLNVLDRHPDLNVTFAHFFFLSAQLDRLAEYLDRYPNMHVDLTPGIEMYFNFGAAPEKARDFFLKYQDRIIFGTDIGARALLADREAGIQVEESLARIEVIRGFLEHDGPFQLSHQGFLFGGKEATFQGIDLPEEVLEKIYWRNFEAFAGAQPKPLVPEAVLAEASRLEFVIQAMAQAQPGTSGDTSSVEALKAHFER
ncbi:MAG: amidohydrolase family protein [Anaerolineaceae bacterium]|nr:amidohydrolase family protein [Anaerolineaceae bacterium]